MRLPHSTQAAQQAGSTITCFRQHATQRNTNPCFEQNTAIENIQPIMKATKSLQMANGYAIPPLLSLARFGFSDAVTKVSRVEGMNDFALKAVSNCTQLLVLPTFSAHSALYVHRGQDQNKPGCHFYHHSKDNPKRLSLRVF